MKKYKNGKMIDTPKEDAEKLQRRTAKHRATNRASSKDYDVRIKALEEAVAALIAKQENKEEV